MVKALYQFLKSVATVNGFNYYTSAARVALNIEARKMTRTDFEQFLLWEGVVVLKELILNSFYFGTGVVVGVVVWWS